MRLSIRAFGLTIFEIETTPDTEVDDDNYVIDGGTLGSDYIADETPSDCFMGFTNGRETEDD